MGKVRFKEGAICRDSPASAHFYMAGNESQQEGSLVEWRCGLEGIDSKYLPDTCRNRFPIKGSGCLIGPDPQPFSEFE